VLQIDQEIDQFDNAGVGLLVVGWIPPLLENVRSVYRSLKSRLGFGERPPVALFVIQQIPLQAPQYVIAMHKMVHILEMQQ
jgi:hypothetical protein